MFTTYATLTLAAISAVSASALPRTASSSAAGPAPSTYNQPWLEPYAPYHERYQALSCGSKHNTPFFDDCCHPMLKWEKLQTARKPYCIPGAATSHVVSAHAVSSTVSHAASKTSSAVVPTSTADECYEDDDDCECVDDDGDDGEDCEEGDEDCECEEEGESSSVHPTATHSHSVHHSASTHSVQHSTSTHSRSVVIVTSYSTASGATATSTVAPSSSKSTTVTSSKSTTVSSSKSTTPAATSSSTSTTSAAPQTTETPSSTVKTTTAATTADLTKQTTGSYSGGVATFFWQGGVAGACGKVHPDTATIAAIDAKRYGNDGDVSLLCGKQVKVTNEKNGKSVLVTIADDCPTCDNGNSIDLSHGAFTQIATEEEGEVPVTVTFV